MLFPREAGLPPDGFLWDLQCLGAGLLPGCVGEGGPDLHRRCPQLQVAGTGARRPWRLCNRAAVWPWPVCLPL